MVATTTESSSPVIDDFAPKKGYGSTRFLMGRGRGARNGRAEERNPVVDRDASRSPRMSASFLRSTLRRATSLASISSSSTTSSKPTPASGHGSRIEEEQGHSPRSHRALFRMHRPRSEFMKKQIRSIDRQETPGLSKMLNLERRGVPVTGPVDKDYLPAKKNGETNSSRTSTPSSVTGHDTASAEAWRIGNICPNGPPTPSDWWRREETEDRKKARITSVDDELDDAIIMEDGSYSVGEKDVQDDEDINAGSGRGKSSLRDFYCGLDPTQILVGGNNGEGDDEDAYDDLTPMGSTETPSASHSSGRASQRRDSAHSSRPRSVGLDDELETMPSIEVRPRRRRFYNCGRTNWERVRSSWRTVSDRSLGKSLVSINSAPELTPQQYDDVVAGLTQPLQRSFELPEKMPLADLIQVYVAIWEAEGTE